MPHVTVRVPASTSNLGPGFDCLGVALRIYNNVTVRRGGAEWKSIMMREAADFFFQRSACRPFAFTAKITGDVPTSRGLGSSVTVRLGILHGLNLLADRPLPRAEIFQICAELEGHPDNAAPAEFGGFNVARAWSATRCRRDDPRADRAARSSFTRQRFAVSSALKFILLIPDFEVRTSAARALLPRSIPRKGAIDSCGNACTITAAFASGQYQNLRGAFRDHLHQPYRKQLVPFFDDAVSAAEDAGALGAFLSGSGSTIAAVALGGAQKVAAAMAVVSKDARVIVATADNRGAHIVSR